MSLSLIAVFIPILLMGGIVGRLFREFAVTLSVAILISLVVSLTTTPMMCAQLLRPPARSGARPAGTAPSERAFERDAAAATAARWPGRCATPALVLADPARDRSALNVYLFMIVPEGLLPAAGHRPADRRHPGRPEHLVPGDAAEAARSSSTSCSDDPAVDSVVGFTGGGADQFRLRVHRR